MKTLLCCLAVVCLTPAAYGQITAPLTVAEAQREAIRRHPDISVQGSPLNVEFVRLYVHHQETRADFFKASSWPIRVADEAAEKARGPHAPISLVNDLNAQTASHWGAEDVSGRVVAHAATGGVLLNHNGKTIFVHGLPNEGELTPGSAIPIAWGLSFGSRKEGGISYQSYRVMTETPASDSRHLAPSASVAVYDAASFLGLTEDQLIQRLGEPLSSEVHPSPDGPFKMIVFSKAATHETFFTIFESDGLVSSGQYRGVALRSR